MATPLELGETTQRARRQNTDHRICELMARIPSGEAVERTYDPAKERIRVADYAIDSTLARVK